MKLYIYIDWHLLKRLFKNCHRCHQNNKSVINFKYSKISENLQKDVQQWIYVHSLFKNFQNSWRLVKMEQGWHPIFACNNNFIMIVVLNDRQNKKHMTCPVIVYIVPDKTHNILCYNLYQSRYRKALRKIYTSSWSSGPG